MNCDFCYGYDKIIIEDEEVNRVLLETESFYVIPPIGSFVEGYLLIVSKKHIPSMGYLLEEQYEELSKLITFLRAYLKEVYNSDTLIFEHGTGSIENTSSASIVHAHIHVIPINSSIMYQIENHFGKENISCIPNIKCISEYGKKHHSYLYYQDIDCQQYIINDLLCTSQILRKFIFEELNKWDWRKYPEYKNVLKTLNKVSVYNIKEEYYQFNNLEKEKM